MNRRYFVEEDENINVDVQVGPEKEIEVEAEPEEAVPSPVDMAKAAPENVPVAAVAHDNDDPAAGNDQPKLEFYVNADDVAKYADLNEMTMLNALNSIIYCNEAHGMRADNTIIMVSEASKGYVRNLEKHGAACKLIKEAEGDIEMDVQVGPNGEDMSVEADPQEANPVDAVKRQYDNVVVAKQGDEFFMDVEDVQKCADLNCESVIKTLNGIIAANEDTDISADNIVLLMNEGSVVSSDMFDSLEEAGVNIQFFEEAVERKNVRKQVKNLISEFLLDNGCEEPAYSMFYIGGENSKFKKGEGNTILIGIAPKQEYSTTYTSDGYQSSRSKQDKEGFRAVLKCLSDNKEKLAKYISKELDMKVESVKVTKGRLGVTNVAVTFA